MSTALAFTGGVLSDATVAFACGVLSDATASMRLDAGTPQIARHIKLACRVRGIPLPDSSAYHALAQTAVFHGALASLAADPLSLSDPTAHRRLEQTVRAAWHATNAP